MTYFTVKQVAERWACSTAHVTRLCRRGELRAMRVGVRGWRISAEAVEAYRAKQMNAPETAPELAPVLAAERLPDAYADVYRDLWGVRP